MPNYYSYYTGTPQYPVGGAYFTPYVQPQMQVPMSGAQQNPQYMIQVDGEVAARAWQAPANLPPRTLIPLWDYDGRHVYFKSTDEYGRMNPIRKATVIFEDEQQNLPQGQSGQVQQQQQNDNGVSGAQSIELPDMSRYMTKDDFESFKQDIRSMLTAQAQNNHASGNQGNNYSGTNQNGNESRGGGRK